MKKLSLKNLQLEANHMLQREQLKTVFGGIQAAKDSDCDPFESDCPSGEQCCGPAGAYFCQSEPCS